MATIDYSIGFTAAEIKEILAVQKAELTKTLAAYANDGSTVTTRRIDVPRSGATTRPGRVSGTGSIGAFECLRAAFQFAIDRGYLIKNPGVTHFDVNRHTLAR